MHTTNLRKVGGSVMLAVPPALLESLKLKVGEAVDIAPDGQRLLIEAAPRPHDTLAELLTPPDYLDAHDQQDQDRASGAGCGGEVIGNRVISMPYCLPHQQAANTKAIAQS